MGYRQKSQLILYFAFPLKLSIANRPTGGHKTYFAKKNKVLDLKQHEHRDLSAPADSKHTTKMW